MPEKESPTPAPEQDHITRTITWPAVAAGLLIIMLAACVGSDSGSDGGSEGGGVEGIRLAVVFLGAETDPAFTESIIEGVKAISGVSDVAITLETPNERDAAAAVRGYADDGYDLILTHGSQHGDLVIEVALEFPDTAFAWGTAADTFGLENVSSYTASSDEGGYVLGVLAGDMCSRIGVVGSVEMGHAKLYVDGFKLGAAAGGADVDVEYIGSLDDDQRASDTASAMVRRGADCLTGTGGMTVGASGVAEQSGLSWFGTRADAAPFAANDVVVAKQVYRWEVILQDLVDDVADGSVGGNIYGIDLENGGLVVELGDVAPTDEMIELVSQVSDQVVAREVTTEVDG